MKTIFFFELEKAMSKIKGFRFKKNLYFKLQQISTFIKINSLYLSC